MISNILEYKILTFFFKGTKRTGNESEGNKEQPLIKISNESVVIDILHEFLRLTDLLPDVLLDVLFRSENFFNNTKYDPAMHQRLASLASFLHQSCGLKTFDVNSKQDDIRQHLKSFTGP